MYVYPVLRRFVYSRSAVSLMHIVGIKTSMAILGPRAAVPGRTRTRALQAGRVDRPRGAGGKASDYDHAYTGHSLLRSAVSALAFWTTPLAYCKKCAQRSFTPEVYFDTVEAHAPRSTPLACTAGRVGRVLTANSHLYNT